MHHHTFNLEQTYPSDYSLCKRTLAEHAHLYVTSFIKWLPLLTNLHCHCYHAFVETALFCFAPIKLLRSLTDIVFTVNIVHIYNKHISLNQIC